MKMLSNKKPPSFGMLPKEISEISTINTFRYIDQSIIEDNLKRIEDYKKNR